MKIRSTLVFLAAVMVLMLPALVTAQLQPRVPRVGVLRPGSPPPADFGQREAFERGLRELGWTPGTSILIDYRYGEGNPERLSELAAELARVPVDVIVASATVGVRAAQQATRTIPIVMSTLPDPVGAGFVTSLAHPGGNDRAYARCRGAGRQTDRAAQGSRADALASRRAAQRRRTV